LGALLGGAVVTETVFTIPVWGGWWCRSISRRDYPLIQGAIMLTAGIFVLVNLLVDVCMSISTPGFAMGS